MIAIFEAMTFLSTRGTWHLYLAAVLIPVALIFDVLDGTLRSRWILFNDCEGSSSA
jgi:phosphatidylglycerophosphate synthase